MKMTSLMDAGSIGLTLEGTAPVSVTSVVPNGVADLAGIAVGDRIFEVSGRLASSAL